MIVNKQKPIELKNECGALYQEDVLKEAILWHTDYFYGRPVQRLKKVFIYGKYPAVSIHNTKIHIHRLIYSYFHRTVFLGDDFIHHLNHNKLDARLDNLLKIKVSEHQSMHNKGKIVSDETKKKHTENNRRLWNTRWKHRRIYENPELLK